MSESEPKNKKRSSVGLIFSFLVSAGLLIFVFKDVEWAVLLGQMDRIQWHWVPVLAALVILSFVFRAYRWRYLLPDGNGYTTRQLFEATWLGNVATFILPLRAGEFVRPWLLTRWGQVRFFTAFASVVTERVFDVLSVLLLLAISLSRISSTPPLIRRGAQALGVVAGGIILFMVLTYLYGEQLKQIFDRYFVSRIKAKHPEIARKLNQIADEVITGLRAISSFKDLILIIILGLGLWGSQAAVFYLAFFAFGEPASIWAGILVTVTVALAVAAPSAPGFLGTFQIGVQVALNGIYTYSNEFSLAYSLLTHVVTALTVIAVGFIIMARTGLSFRDLKSGGSSESHPEVS